MKIAPCRHRFRSTKTNIRSLERGTRRQKQTRPPGSIARDAAPPLETSRTVDTDIFQFQRFANLDAVQLAFDAFRADYNTNRPHDGIDLAVPGDRYRPSTRPFPDDLPQVVYADGDLVKVVQSNGCIWLDGRYRYVSEALIGQPVGVRLTPMDGVVTVRFCHVDIVSLDLRDGSCSCQPSPRTCGNHLPGLYTWAGPTDDVAKRLRRGILRSAQDDEGCRGILPPRFALGQDDEGG